MMVNIINKFQVEVDGSVYIMEFVGTKKELVKRIDEDLAHDGTFRIIRFLTKAKTDNVYLRIIKW